jgi:hypothetical protein
VSASYDTSRSTDKDKVRALLGDTDVTPESDALFQDEEITAVLADTGSLSSTVSQLAYELVVRFARKPVNIKAGDVQVDYSSRLPAWRELAGRQSAASGLSFVTANYTGALESDEYSRLPWWCL